VDVVFGGLFEQVALEFLRGDGDALLLVLFGHHLDQALELRATVVATATGGHLCELAHLRVIGLVLVKHLPEGLANSRWSLSLQHQLVHL
jgi:hypothetical protein